MAYLRLLLGLAILSATIYGGASSSTTTTSTVASTKITISEIGPMDNVTFCEKGDEERFVLCMKALSSDPRSVNNTDPYVFANIIFNYAINNVSDTIAYIHSIQEGVATPIYDYIHNCGSNYNEARHHLKNGRDLFNEKKYAEAEQEMTDAGDEVMRLCTLQAVPGAEDPLKQRNQVTDSLSNICFEAVDLFMEI